MPNLQATINQFVVGDNVPLRFNISNVPEGDTVVKVWLTMKSSENAEDSEAVLQKSVTASNTPSGQITDDGAAGTAVAVFTLVPADTVMITGGKNYYFDVQVLTALGAIYTPIKGTVIGVKQITQATS